MKTITVDGRTYEVVKKMPKGFVVWNIGVMKGYEEYLPLCETIGKSFNVNIKTLKVIKLDTESVKILNRASGYGVDCLRKAKTTLNRVAKSNMMKRKQEFAEMSLPIFEKIS